jgi:hypothetical protein
VGSFSSIFVKVDSSGGSERDEEAILNEWPDGLDICRVDVVGRWQFRNERRGWYEICNHGSSLLEVHEAELVWLAFSLIISVLAPLQGLKGFQVNTCIPSFVTMTFQFSIQAQDSRLCLNCNLEMTALILSGKAQTDMMNLRRSAQWELQSSASVYKTRMQLC